MQQLAREIGRGDTAFVSRRCGRGSRPADAILHLEVRGAVCRARDGRRALRAQHASACCRDRPLRQLSGNGIITVDVGRATARPRWACACPRRAVRELLPAELDVSARRARSEPCRSRYALPGGDLHDRQPALDAGPAQSRSRSASCYPNLDALGAPHAPPGRGWLFRICAHRRRRCRRQTEARMFCPAIGVPEDAVSGNAHGMLGVFLVRHRLLAARDGIARFLGLQGRALGTARRSARRSAGIWRRSLQRARRGARGDRVRDADSAAGARLSADDQDERGQRHATPARNGALNAMLAYRAPEIDGPMMRARLVAD